MSAFTPCCAQPLFACCNLPHRGQVHGSWMVEHSQTLLVCCRQLKLLREEGKLPKGGLEAGKLHGLTEADLKGPVLKIFKPSQSDVERLEYVPACCSSVQACHLMPCLEHGMDLACVQMLLSPVEDMESCGPEESI